MKGYRQFVNRLIAFSLTIMICTLTDSCVMAGSASIDSSEDIVLLEKDDHSMMLGQEKTRLYELCNIDTDEFGNFFLLDTEPVVMRSQEMDQLLIMGSITPRDCENVFSANSVSLVEHISNENNKPLLTTPPFKELASLQTQIFTPASTPTSVRASVSTMELQAQITPAPSASPTSKPTILLKKGDKGDYLLKVKDRLYELGYFTDTNFSLSFTSRTEEVVKQFQEMNVLPVTGIYTDADDEILFSEVAIPAPTPTPPPTAEPLPTVRPIQDSPVPQRDGSGYLIGGGEYVYENEELGQWVYLNENIQIIINRYERNDKPLVWIETEILLRNGERLRNIHIEGNDKGQGMRFRTPDELAIDNGLLFGFTDDFYDYRVYHHEQIGIVIRDGVIKYDQPYSKRQKFLPNLDMMAEYADGSFVCYPAGSITADELVEAGAVNVYCFGPAVIHDGVIDTFIGPKDFAQLFPRQLLGMIEPNHYFILTVLGRTSTSNGIGCLDAAKMMLARGVKEALNLDGGNTMALVFRGKMLNEKANWKTRKYVRSVSSLIGVGNWEASQQTVDE